MKVESIAECSPQSILQYFWPALSENWSWKPIFGLFEIGYFTQVLLYMIIYFVKMKMYLTTHERNAVLKEVKDVCGITNVDNNGHGDV